MSFFDGIDRKSFKSKLQNFKKLSVVSFLARGLRQPPKIIIILLFTLLLFEIVLRLSFNFLPKVRYFLYSSRYDLNFAKIKTHKDLLKYEPCPLIPQTSVNGFVVNKDGFYTPDYSLKKEEKTTRIGFIGDSFAVGVVPYPQNFINVFQSLVQEGSKTKKTEVINWGVPCVGPKFEEKILEIDGYKTDPDYLIWMFFVGNDFTDEYFPGKPGIGNQLTKNILTLRLIRNLQKTFQGLSLNRQIPTDNKLYKESGVYVGLPYPYDDGKPTFNKEKYISLQAEKITLFNKEKFPLESWTSIQNVFMRFKENCEQRLIKCLVVIVPDEIQVDRDLFREVLDESNIDRESLSLYYPQQLLAGFFEQKEIPYLDLLPVFQKEGANKKLYRPFDTHWNIQGNSVAGEVIAEYFKGAK